MLFADTPRDGAIDIRADATVYLGNLGAGRGLEHRLGAGMGVWLHVIDGNIAVAGEEFGPGDGASIEEANRIQIESPRGSVFLLFDLK